MSTENIITEPIVGYRKTSIGKTIVITKSKKEVWVLADQLAKGAKEISYTEHKAGDTYLAGKNTKVIDPATGQPYKVGQPVPFNEAGLDFVCFDTIAEQSPLELALAILKVNPNATLSLK